MLLDQAAPCPRQLHLKCISRGRVTLHHQYTNTLQHHPRGTGWLKKKKLIFKSERGATINSSRSHWREGCMGTVKFCQGPGLKTYWKHQTKEKDPPLSSGPQRTFHTVKDPTDLSTLGTCFKGLTDLPPVPASALLSPHY